MDGDVKIQEASAARLLRSRHSNPERGASLVEYALLVALLCVVAVGGVRAVGVSVRGTFNESGEGLGSGGFTIGQPLADVPPEEVPPEEVVP